MADQFIEDIFVGSEIGYLKAVDLRKNTFNNVAKPPSPSESADQKTQEICGMCWKNSERNQMLLGLRSGLVKTYDVEQSTFVDERDCDVKDTHFTGLFCYNRLKSKLEVIFQECDIITTTHILLGQEAKQNDLKIWDLNKSGENIFKAKNVRNDTLDLRVPVWVTDLGFLPSAGSPKVVTGTGYHQLRLYDTAAKNRPVFSMDFEDCPISSLCVTDQENTFIVGNTAGTMSVVDLRKGQAVGNFKGFAGSIRCIEYCEETRRVAACGLDRFLRVYDLKSRKLLQKVYLKTRLNCLLFSSVENQNKRSQLSQECQETMQDNNNLRKRERTTNIDDDDKEEVDRIWESMEVVKTDSAKHSKESRK
ncbi:hypothetical protein QZH41_014033, partial [Actinostola sp. cb2023]